MSYGLRNYNSSTGTFSFPSNNEPYSITLAGLENGVNNLEMERVVYTLSLWVTIFIHIEQMDWGGRSWCR